MTLGKPIALGRTAEVYAWADGQVLKLFRPGWGKQAAEFASRGPWLSQGYHPPLSEGSLKSTAASGSPTNA